MTPTRAANLAGVVARRPVPFDECPEFGTCDLVPDACNLRRAV